MIDGKRYRWPAKYFNRVDAKKLVNKDSYSPEQYEIKADGVYITDKWGYFCEYLNRQVYKCKKVEFSEAELVRGVAANNRAYMEKVCQNYEKAGKTRGRCRFCHEYDKELDTRKHCSKCENEKIIVIERRTA